VGTIVTASEVDAVMKELYEGGVPTDIMQGAHPLLAMMPKDSNAYGEYIVVPVHYDLSPGRSADIAALLGSDGPIGANKTIKFNVPLVEDYAATWLDDLTLMKMSNDRGAFVEGRKFEVDSLIKQLGNSAGHALYRSGTGSVAQLLSGSTITGTTFTLANGKDAKFFGVGDQIQFQNGDGGALRDSGDFLTITKVDPDATTNQITTATAGTNIAALADTDYIVKRGDTNEKVKGLAAWIPLTAPSGGENFFGADRSVRPDRLAGSRLNQPTYAVEDSILELADILAERGAKGDLKAFISPRQFTRMVKRLNAKVEYNDAGGTVKYGFAHVSIFTAAGVVRVYADPDCPDNRGYLLNLDTWRMKHLGEMPHIVVSDGIRALRRGGSDSIEIRVRQYYVPICRAPGENGVFSCQL
jgi:hypothetical protein